MLLSGADYGGTEVTWTVTGTLADGRKYMNTNGLVYADVDGATAVYVGSHNVLVASGAISE